MLPVGTKKALPDVRLKQATPPREQPVSGLAYEKLLEFILSGELAPGTVLNERRLALELEISRTPVREAISRLAAEGLVVQKPYRGVFLTEVGQRIAGASRTRHRTVEAFLLSLGVAPETARIDAEGIEHHVSEETLAAFRHSMAASKSR